jgi:Na+/proline symporter
MKSYININTIIIIIIVIIIIIIIGKDTISFMHGIYTSIPETNHVPNQYNVAAILSLLFMLP